MIRSCVCELTFRLTLPFDTESPLFLNQTNVPSEYMVQYRFFHLSPENVPSTKLK